MKTISGKIILTHLKSAAELPPIFIGALFLSLAWRHKLLSGAVLFWWRSVAVRLYRVVIGGRGDWTGLFVGCNIQDLHLFYGSFNGGWYFYRGFVVMIRTGCAH